MSAPVLALLPAGSTPVSTGLRRLACLKRQSERLATDLDAATEFRTEAEALERAAEVLEWAQRGRERRQAGEVAA